MRAGKTVGSVETASVTESDLAAMMVGHEVVLRVDRSTYEGPRKLSVEGLTLKNEAGRVLAEDLSLNVHGGEIVGLVGVEGNGQAELLEAVAGLRPVASGQIRMEADEITAMPVLARRQRGLASIPEDRIAQGLAVGATTAENLVATRLDNPRFVSRGLLNLKGMTQNARELIDRFSIRVGGPGFQVGTLSGGNMQKVVVARELAEQPEVLLVNQPTRGVDLAATQFIWQSITNARDGGAAVLLSSADLSELLALSDRLVVFYHGRIVAAFENDEAVTAEMLGAYMLGISSQDDAEMKAALK